MNDDEVISKLREYFGTDIIDKLDFESFKGKKDIFSELFEKIITKSQREAYAQFFTHKELIDFILSNIPLKQNSTVLDPACGAGAFLVESAKRGISPSNLFGIDIDSIALNLCRINLNYQTDNNMSNLVNEDTIKNGKLSRLFPDVANEGGFDLIIGNPPFQNLKKNIDYITKDYTGYDIINGVVNSATLMILKGYEFLKEGGYLGFVLPKNIIRVDSFSKLRNFLTRNTKIIHIYDLGHYFKDVRGDQIILIFQKKRLDQDELKDHKIIISINKKNMPFNKPYQYKLNQSELLYYEHYPIFYHEDIHSFAKKLWDIKNNLSDVTIDIFRGLGISSNNELLTNEKVDGYNVVYRGDSIKRFGIKYPLYLDVNKVLEQNKLSRLSKDKIILQNLCSKEGGIFATIANKNELTLDTVTNIVPKNEEDLYFLLGLINSKISNFFMIFLIYLNSNFTMHTDKKYLSNIPIKFPNDIQKEDIINLVEKMLKVDDKYSNDFFELYNELNNKLYEVYEFSEPEINLIESLLKEVMSVKQNGRTNE